MKKILIVDDDAALLLYLCCNLRKRFERLTILSAKNGQRAVDIMSSHRIDMLITDLNMPVMDGFELLAHTAKNYPSVTVMVMTGNDSAEVSERLLPFRVSQCLAKPFGLDQLLYELGEEIDRLSGR
ncbi:MAG: response regulator [Nitrospirae bacterium]|nr:MAG: response regulator [Nitrospirota bacterium]